MSRTMSDDEWARVNELFHRALVEPPARRAAFLEAACSNQRLRAEVLALLASHEQARDFLEPRAGAAAELLALARDSGTDDAADAPAVREGQQIGQYRILRTIGRGGMGVVYLAEDTRLGRTVALKAVAPRFAGDQTRRERLRREARAAASLSHPGIATVYALEEFGDHLYIACEYVPGETLREELARGPLSVLRALDTALGIARALASAHDRGVVHRDLKPENVIRSPSGDLKILDFGLARFSDGPHPPAALTEEGTILGTPAYLSPEQARGQEIDSRSDLFSLGIITYELVAGVHPFAGSTTASTIAKILEAEPARIADWRPDGASGEGLDWLEQIARACLQKNPDARYRSTHALVRALEEARAAVAAGQPAPNRSPSAPGTTASGAPDPLWWWQFHQAAASVVYAGLLIPVWYVHGWIAGLPGVLLFLGALVTATVASTLRMHLWFTVRSYPSEWASQQKRSAPWIRLADVFFVIVLMLAAALLLTSHSDIAILLVGAAVAVLLSSTIIEPATTRAAFR